MKNLFLEDIIDEYINYISLYIKPTTRLNIERNVKKHILPYFKKSIYEISNYDIVKWQNIIKEKGYSNSFNNNVHCILQDILNYLNLNYNIEKIQINRKNLYNYNIEKKRKKYLDYKRI